MRPEEIFHKENKRTFVIAEIGSNHNQDINLAFELIDIAKEAGADAVKFQSIKSSELYNLSDLSEKDQELLTKIRFNEEWYSDITNYAKKREITFFSAPTYLKAVDILEAYDVEMYKIASPQTYGFSQLIKKVAEQNKPTLMSTGYCNYMEIERAVKIFLNSGNEKLALFHCVSEYPASPESVNLNFINTLRRMFDLPVGFSDHTLGYNVTLAAVAKGATIIEKHITKSRKMKGPDHFFALEPNELFEMIKAIREVESSFGSESKKELTEFEGNYRDNLKTYVFANRDIESGDCLKEEDIHFYRIPAKKLADDFYIDSWTIKKFIGRKVTRNIKKGDILKTYYWEKKN